MPFEKSPDISCSNCIGACCRAGAALQLTHDEVYRNRRTMALKPMYKERDYTQKVPILQEYTDANGQRRPRPVMMRLPAFYGLYILTEDCGNLTEDNKCGVYEKRPEACRDYEMGSQDCLDARSVFGLDGHTAQVQLGTKFEVRKSPTL